MIRLPRALSRSLSTSSPRAIAVRSPRDGQIFEEIPDCSAEDVDAAVAKAAACAASGWAQPDAVGSRAESLRAIAAAIRRETPRLAALETRDCGKPVSESEVDMGAVSDLFEFYAEIAPAELASTQIAVPDSEFTVRMQAI